MSTIHWCHALTPGPDVHEQPFADEHYRDAIVIPKTKALPVEARKAPLPDRKVYRSMSRSGILLSLACLKGRKAIQPFLDDSPFSVGIYCAIENGPVDLPSAYAMVDVPREDFADCYRKYRNPKMFLTQVTNLAPAQMGIFLSIMGPMNVYNSSVYGSVHAIDQACQDLDEGRVAAALVCSAFSFEDPLVLERVRRWELGDRVLCEGAGAMILTSGKQGSALPCYDSDDGEHYYGIAHQIICQIKQIERENSYAV